MKFQLRICLAIAVSSLVSCEKKPDVVSPEKPLAAISAKPTPLPAPPPAPIPAQTPVILPSPTSPPVPAENPFAEKALYVLKRFSVTTADGMHGFSEGKQVTLIREEAGEYIVADGAVEGRAPKQSFTDDFNAISAMIDKNQQLQQMAQNVKAQQRQLRVAQQTKAAQQAGVDSQARAQNAKQQQIAEMGAQLEGLNLRIGKARSERASKGYPEDGGARYKVLYYYGYYNGVYRRNDAVVSLSSEAAQIEALLDAKRQIESQLRVIK